MDQIKGEGGGGGGRGFGSGGVARWGEKAHNCNWITIKNLRKENKQPNLKNRLNILLDISAN